jgi:hypothetical protein
MTEMNHDDVEAQLSHQASGHAPTIEHDDDDDCSFDGMEVEDWLIKQQAKKNRWLGPRGSQTIRGKRY